MDTLNVELGDRSYPIIIGQNILAGIGKELTEIGFPGHVAVISNPTVDALYGEAVGTSLEGAGFKVFKCNIPDGEQYKTAESLELIYDALLREGFDRGCGLIALGGGVVGDIAGYAAATLLRGIPYVQVPTTLLSQVDSSVGGKTAINHPLGKNLIGAFYQPEMVYIDIETLKTLEPREVSAGMAEVVKYGVIRDADFFNWLETSTQKIQAFDADSLIYAIKRSCQLKADIVSQDEKEGSIRAFLNFGHTFGHAIENLSGYGQWKHGEAVAVGMIVAAKIAHMNDLCSLGDIERLQRLLENLNLPVEPPSHPLSDYVEAMQRDKKVKRGTLSLVLNRGIGDVVIHKVADTSAVFSSILNS